MKFGEKSLFLVLLIAAASTVLQAQEEGERWAVLLAGSSNWWNYGDQACVCHSYHLIHSTGIPDDHIIVMMYDDIANNKANPNPGVVINEPNGTNVYEGIMKDYTGDDVTPETFLKVLSGDETGLQGVGSGKVVKSGPNDKIFVYFNDHGGPGLFCFPVDDLYATDLADTILSMRANDQYKEMVFYMDSCYAGSMFEDLYPEDIGLYAVTSANPKESAYNCCYDEELEAFLAAEFSLAWMKTTEWYGVTDQTFGDQYTESVDLVMSSHVMKYGQMDIQTEALSAFFGPGSANRNPNPFPEICEDDASKSDLLFATLKKRLEHAKDDHAKASLNQQIVSLLANRKVLEDITRQIVMTVTKDEETSDAIMESQEREITQRKCYESAAKAYTRNCFKLSQNTYALQMLPALLNLCENGYEASDIIQATESVCSFSEMNGFH